jgi:hypothetical protein
MRARWKKAGLPQRTFYLKPGDIDGLSSIMKINARN